VDKRQFYQVKHSYHLNMGFMKNFEQLTSAELTTINGGGLLDGLGLSGLTTGLGNALTLIGNNTGAATTGTGNALTLTGAGLGSLLGNVGNAVNTIANSVNNLLSSVSGNLG
jgi:hypothetical protein